MKNRGRKLKWYISQRDNTKLKLRMMIIGENSIFFPYTKLLNSSCKTKTREKMFIFIWNGQSSPISFDLTSKLPVKASGDFWFFVTFRRPGPTRQIPLSWFLTQSNAGFLGFVVTLSFVGFKVSLSFAVSFDILPGVAL